MCPACMASAALLVGSVLSTGGLTALAVKIARSKKGKETEDQEAMQRRNEDGCSNEQ
jgi:hypothetical protein